MPLTRREWLSASLLQTSRSTRPPNVLILITDDQGYGDLSLHGNPHLRTPHLDSIARAGAQFTQFQVCPVCSPTRASLLTGRYNYRTGVVDTYLGRSMMYPDEVTMAEYLAAAGYRTGIFGKWHLGDCYPLRAIDQGFQETVICKGGGISQPSDPPGNSYFDPILYRHGVEKKYRGYCTDIFFNEAIDFIGRHRGEPWFCYLPTNAPHDPLEIANNYVRPFLGQGLDEATAKTYGMVANIEKNTGRLLAKLREMDLERDTILIYMTDNGPQRDRYNAGMRGRKGTVYQGGIRVPFFLRYPKLVKPGTVVDRAAAHIDVLPTILELCGVARTTGQPRLDGRTLAPLLRGETGAWTDRTLFTQWHRGDTPQLFRDCAARTQQYKLINGRELFDLAADPGEKNDLAASLPAIATTLRRETETWFGDVSATRGGYAPPRIHLGAPQEQLTVLTRQDWRGPGASWDATGIGHWEVQIARAASYEIHLRMPAVPGPVKATVHIGANSVEASVPPGATEARFPPMNLAPGPGRVEASLEAAGRTWGPHYIDIRAR